VVSVAVALVISVAEADASVADASVWLLLALSSAELVPGADVEPSPADVPESSLGVVVDPSATVASIEIVAQWW